METVLLEYEIKRVVKWSDIVTVNQELANLPHRLIRRVLKKIESNSHWTLHDKRDLEDLILFIE